METLFTLSICLAAGLAMSRVVKPLKLPAVTGYLLAGILVGPYCLGQLGINGLGLVSQENIKYFGVLSNVALGFIAFTIGNEFRISQLKKIGKKATVVACFEAITASVIVDIVLISLHFILGDKFPLSAAITLGAIAAATAPAATLMVVKQYKAKGKVTEMLLPIVALDDAIGLMIFAISFGIARTIEHGAFNAVSIVLEPVLNVVLSLVLGFLSGLLFTFCQRFFKSNSKRLCLSVTFVLLTAAISMLEFKIGNINISFSPLLVCMMLGTVFCNMCDFSAELMEKTDRWTAPLFILFFVLSGAELEFSVFADIAITGVGIMYIVFRSIGKYSGAYCGSKLMKCDPVINKYLGVTLLPQAGVALGMSVTAQTLGASGTLVRNIVLFAVMVYEIVGPLLTKIALTKSGDIVPRSAQSPSAEPVPQNAKK